MARAWTNLLGKDFMLGIGAAEKDSLRGINFITMGENIRSYKLAWKYLLYAKKNRFTHIYCREEKMLLFMLIYNQLFFRIPLTFCYELHHLMYMDAWWHKRLLKRIEYVISITRAMKDALIKYKYPNSRILVAPDAADISLFGKTVSKNEARAKLGLPLNKKIIIYTGAINEPWKGVGTLYESSKSFDDAHLFLILGGKPHYVDNFRLLYPNRPNFLLLGHKSHAEIPLYLKSADVAVLPNSNKSEVSRISTSPMKLFEYMASGVPIVASDLPSIREILNEKNAIFVEPDNSKDLVFGITRAFEHPETLEGLAKQARLDAEKYTWDKRATDIAKFIQSS